MNMYVGHNGVSVVILGLARIKIDTLLYENLQILHFCKYLSKVHFSDPPPTRATVRSRR